MSGMLITRAELAEVFPNKASALIFVLYMAMFVAQGMLVTASRMGAVSYGYNTTVVVLLTEILKLLASSAAFLKE